MDVSGTSIQLPVADHLGVRRLSLVKHPISPLLYLLTIASAML